MDDLTNALLIAANAHDGQRDKAGEAYILHPLRLMMSFSDPRLRQVALLHDVVEDSELALNDLLDLGITEEVIKAVDAMTKRSGEGYEDYIERLLPNDLARQVKRADLTDNLSRSQKNQRVSDEKMKQYAWALARLDEVDQK